MKNELEDFLRSNREHIDNKSPDPAVLDRILEQMQVKHTSKPRGVWIPFRTLQWAAACLLFIACGIVFRALQKGSGDHRTGKVSQLNRRQMTNPEYDSIAPASPEIIMNQQAKRKSFDTIEEDLAVRKQALFAKTKLQTLTSAKQVMYAGLNNMESPASRISAAYAAGTLKNTGNDVVDALVETLNTDPSANVRLAVLDGLTRFYRDSYVRKKLVASLKKQHDPVVQIALINLLTRMRESGILEELNKIVNDGTTMKAVKDCAYSSIFRLRSS